MSGFPIRPLLSAFGQDKANLAPVVDPSTDLDADDWNLQKWQVAGMGLLVPRVLAKVTVDNPAVLLGRAEVWNPTGATIGDHAPPTPTYVSTGRATLAYATTYPDQKGDAQSLSFSWAFGWFAPDPPTTLKFVRVAPVGATLSTLTICVFDAAGALEDGNDVWLMAG